MVDKLAMFDVALEAARPDQRQRLIGAFTRATESRLRFYGTSGRKIDESLAHEPPTYTLRDPDLQQWKRDIGRALRRGTDRSEESRVGKKRVRACRTRGV